jgi:RimJ/RimL family protein N-acetyltransferase
MRAEWDTRWMSVSELKIETPRLLLRPTQLEDFEPWADLMADAEAARFIGGLQSRSVVWRSLMCMAGAWHLKGFAMFSVIEKSTGRWLGRVGPWQPEGWPGTEVGWGLRRESWGRGFATEAAAASIDWAFRELGWTEVIHTIAPDNVMSQAVARKLGARNLRPGRLPAPHETAVVDIWGQSREEWQAFRQSAAAR